AVREAGEGLGERDEGNARGGGGVAVVVGIYGAVEAGDDLVAPRVDRRVADRVGLPAGDPDRQHGGTGGDSRQAERSGTADEQPGRLGSVALELRGVVAAAGRARAPAAADDGCPRLHTPP